MQRYVRDPADSVLGIRTLPLAPPRVYPTPRRGVGDTFRLHYSPAIDAADTAEQHASPTPL
ncbi:hypothetical protein E2C01_019404 [Portunus trituberculatus]|uniref:Uncharacterized protein n=1 Tax=Portunus trituberculatus TaxID=210409 RepID=A0A5B7DXT7_PORTR|nr:hypothetical protein [Portunus trituberculatus]